MVNPAEDVRAGRANGWSQYQRICSLLNVARQ